MKFGVVIVALLASLLAGCGASPGTPFSNSSVALAGNWQIQSSAIPSAATPQGIVLLGALESSGSQVSGNFRFTNLAQPEACGLNQVVVLSGAVESNNTLTLASAALPNGTTIKVSLKMTSTQPYSGIGKIEVDGATCAVASASAFGSQIATTTGTFIGTLTPSANGAPAPVTQGSATVTLAQSATPGADGQFTTTGTLSYQFGSCSGKVPLSGYVSGVGMSFWDFIISSGGTQEVNLNGTTNLTATQIKAGYLSLTPAPCSTDPNSNAVFSGNLKRH